MKDLAAEPRHAGEVQRLTALLQDEQKRAADTQPLMSDNPQSLDFDFTKVKPKAAAE